MDSSWDSKSRSAGAVPWGGLSSIMIGFFGVILVQIFVGGLIFTFAPELINGEGSNSNTFLVQMIIGIAELLLIIATLIYFKASLKDIRLGRIKITNITRIVPVYFVYLMVLFASTAAMSYLLGEDIVNQNQDVGFSAANANNFELTLIFISLVVVVPFVEEVIFRGFMFQGLIKSFGFVASSLITSLLFALVHFQINVGVDTFILSLGLTYLVHTTKSLWPAIGLHALKNAVAFVLLFIVGVS
jgi:membrane protease YdiL (CAAX protease family)